MALQCATGQREEEFLIAQIENEIKKIYVSLERLFNNQALTESNDAIEKCLITNYCFSACLVEKGIAEDRNEDYIATLQESIQQELDCLSNDLTKMVTEINDCNDTITNIDTNISNLNTMTDSISNDCKSIINVNHIVQHIKMRFKKEKSDLKTTITTLFADNLDIQDIIARIIEHHFKEGSDKYLQLENEDNISEQIEILRRTNLFDINPYDILQIKLADLL